MRNERYILSFNLFYFILACVFSFLYKLKREEVSFVVHLLLLETKMGRVHEDENKIKFNQYAFRTNPLKNSTSNAQHHTQVLQNQKLNFF